MPMPRPPWPGSRGADRALFPATRPEPFKGAYLHDTPVRYCGSERGVGFLRTDRPVCDSPRSGPVCSDRPGANGYSAEGYSVTRSSHLTIESMTTIEIVQATTKTPHVIQMGIDS